MIRRPLACLTLDSWSASTRRCAATTCSIRFSLGTLHLRVYQLLLVVRETGQVDLLIGTLNSDKPRTRIEGSARSLEKDTCSNTVNLGAPCILRYERLTCEKGDLRRPSVPGQYQYSSPIVHALKPTTQRQPNKQGCITKTGED